MLLFPPLKDFFIKDEDRFNLGGSFNSEAFSQHIQRYIQGHSNRSKAIYLYTAKHLLVNIT